MWRWRALWFFGEFGAVLKCDLSVSKRIWELIKTVGCDD